MKMGSTDEREEGKWMYGGGKEGKKVMHNHLIAVRMYSPE